MLPHENKRKTITLWDEGEAAKVNGALLVLVQFMWQTSVLKMERTKSVSLTEPVCDEYHSSEVSPSLKCQHNVLNDSLKPSNLR